MGNFYFSKIISIFFIDSVRVFFSDCNGIKKLYPLTTKFPRKKGKYVALKLDLSLFQKRKFVGSVLDFT
jgi:hypothetical protein